MNKILNAFGFAIIKPKAKKQKRETLSILVITAIGEVITELNCYPFYKEQTIKDAFINYPDAVCLNIIGLNGHTKVIQK